MHIINFWTFKFMYEIQRLQYTGFPMAWQNFWFSSHGRLTYNIGSPLMKTHGESGHHFAKLRFALML